MSKIPAAVVTSDFGRRLSDLGFKLCYRGKVGELYEVPGKPDQLLMTRTDRLSIFDLVLPRLVSRKGEVLTALTHFWLTQVFPDMPHHLLAWGSNKELWRAAGWDNVDDLCYLSPERTMLIKRCEGWPFEMIYRGHIGGSVWKEYQTNGTAGGQSLFPGLTKWQTLSVPVFTPTTKANVGHDMPVTVSDYLAQTGEVGARLMEMCDVLYTKAYQYAADRGILILDTKFEVGRDGTGEWVFTDEVLTPDSSRFTTPRNLSDAIAEGRDPAFYDKEPVRIWGRQIVTPWGTGLQNLDVEDDRHLEFVADLEVPDEVIESTATRYQRIFEMIAGLCLDRYQSEVMEII